MMAIVERGRIYRRRGGGETCTVKTIVRGEVFYYTAPHGLRKANLNDFCREWETAD